MIHGPVHLLVAAHVQLDHIHAIRVKLLQLFGTFSAVILRRRQVPSWVEPKGGGWRGARHLYLQETPREDCEAELVQVLRKCASKPAVATCNEHSFALHLKSRVTCSNI